MPHLEIKIVGKGESIQIDNLNEPYLRGTLDTFVILEGGMQSGKDSVMLRVIDENGVSIIIETSAEIITSAYHVMKGAQARFIHKKE